MDINSPEFANSLNEIIEQKVQTILAQTLDNYYGIMKGFSATVTAVSGNLASVQLAGDTTILTNIKNKSGQTLAINDEVFLFTISSLSNAFIGVCKNKPI